MTATIVASSIALIFLSFAQGEQFQFQIRNVDGSSGLYFEETGKLFFYDNEWKIVTNVNLTEYHTHFNNIQNTVHTIVANCEELKLLETEKSSSFKGNEGCGPMLYQLKILMADIEENDNHWFGKDARTKRHILSELVSDDWPNDYVTFFGEFTNMSALGSETRTSPNRETSYIKSSINSFGKSADQLAINDYVTNQLSGVHNTLVAAQNGSVNAVRLFQLRTTIQDVISHQMLILASFASKQKQYLDIMPLVGMKNVQISSVILSSGTVVSELNTIRHVVIEKGLGFPLTVTSENVHFLLQTSSPHIALYRDQIFVTFKLPLISKRSGNFFTLVKVSSALHNIVENYYAYVDSNHEFIAIDAHKEKYVTLTVDDLNNCRRMSNGTSMICKQTSPTMLTSSSSDCEINILLDQQHQNKGHFNCTKRYMRNNAPILIKVLEPNSWLVTMPHAAKARYMCDGKNIHESFVQINGLLTIDNNCKFSVDNVVVTGHNTFAKSLIREHQKGNINDGRVLPQNTFDNVVNDANFVCNNVLQVISFGDSEKLRRISYKKEEVNTTRYISTLFGNWSRLDTAFISMSIILIALLLVMSFIVIWIDHLRGKQEKLKLTVQPEPTDSSSAKPTLSSTTTTADSSNAKPSNSNSNCPKPSAPLYPSISIELN